MNNIFPIQFTATHTALAAREINKDAGTVKRVLRLFDALAVVDTEGALVEARKATSGETVE